MEVKIALKMQFSACIDTDKFARRPSVSLPFSQKLREQHGHPISCHFQPRRTSNWQKHVASEASGSYRNFPAPILESGSFPPSLDEALILKDKSQEILPYIDGRCIYLVGMMGSGKTTIGKILSEVLGYSFCDSDTLVELAVKGTSVAEIFNLYGEGFFRNKETETLQNLSLMRHMVVSTGGGAVVRPINWKYMAKGISVWLDVPLEALARRISAVGTNSRPLLHHDSGDAYNRVSSFSALVLYCYTGCIRQDGSFGLDFMGNQLSLGLFPLLLSTPLQTLTRLSNLWKERGDAYANANARVSLEEIAAKLGHRDVTNLTPTVIAIEALLQIEAFLKGENGMDIATL
ncbi:hypothetical protein PVL29_027045 [Vitis rotundifolia]|uniref:shikimate kinase n=1 Tax=Vitis rotundifolia TaxID=103349 RepID=A0AA39D4Y0_VITRO|nr:hypothetical protein PVL29_027045 [Vitis rotundifolia]